MSLQLPRTLSVFAFDPGVAGAFENRKIKTLPITVPWEMERLDESEPFVGPRGEYLEVVDYDPASGVFYHPVDLNDPVVRLNNGLTPAVDNPQFHQQMVYAVAMNTIAAFEQALGRVALWAPRSWRHTHTRSRAEPDDDMGFVPRLRIYPHALREANAYYDPTKKALLFGYFQAGPENQQMLPGTMVFTCLSHDVIVHETCHALLDGLHPHFAEATNPDVLALHEAFSDVVALLQHFSHPEVLEDQIARTRGDLEQQNLLGQLAQEFGQALGRGHALRDALGGMKDGVWQAAKPDNTVLERTASPHARGSVLVAAIFRAFLTIYKSRIADLLRIASDGRGILPDGELDPDLKRRLAREASKSARHLMQMCIRALDYCPPVDVTFGDYLRAMVTADADLYPEDTHGYRAALIEAFTAWGIRPRGMQIVTEQTLLWPTVEEASLDDHIQQFTEDVGTLLNNPQQSSASVRIASVDVKGAGDGRGTVKESGMDHWASMISRALGEEDQTRITSKGQTYTRYFNKQDVMSRNLLELGLAADRKVEHLVRLFYGELFWEMMHDPKHDRIYDLIGIDLTDAAPRTINRSATTGRPALQVNSVRMANRIGDRGQVEREYVVELVQTRAGFYDLKDQAKADREGLGRRADFRARSGVTLLIDARSFQIRRIIRTDGMVSDDAVMERHRAYRRTRSHAPSNAFDGLGAREDKSQSFAALHRHADLGDAS